MRSRSDNTRLLWLSRRARRIGLILLAGLLVGGLLPGRLIVATSDSLEHRIFFKVPVPSRIELGDYLLFRLKREEHAKHIRQGIRENDVLIKRVGCVPGRILTKDGAGTFFCDDTRLGTALKRDSTGHPLPVFGFNGKLPADSYYMMGTNPRSFDSRYFGLIDADEFLSKALPLW